MRSNTSLFRTIFEGIASLEILIKITLKISNRFPRQAREPPIARLCRLVPEFVEGYERSESKEPLTVTLYISNPRWRVSPGWM